MSTAVKAAYMAAFDLLPPALPDTASEIGDGIEATIEALLPPGAIIPCVLTAGQIAANFTGGLGDSATAWHGWAICDGNNGTPNLSDKFVRHKSTGSGGAGGGDTVSHSANAAIESVDDNDDGVQIDVAHKNHIHDDHDNRPAYFELVYLQRV